MKLASTIISIILVMSCPAMALGQIFRADPDTVVVTAYSSNDSIFVFNHTSTGSLLARSPGGVQADFEWIGYDTTLATRGFNIPVKTESNTLSSMLTGLTSGGYKVHVTASGVDETYIAWVFINSLSVKLEKDNFGFVKYFSSTCEYLDLSATATYSAYTYFDPSTDSKLALTNRVSYAWSSDPSIEFYLTDTLKSIRIKSERLPYDTTLFYVTATDKYKLSKKDSVWYPPILSKAKFDTTGSQYVAHNDVYEGENSAPFLVYFKNESENAVKYTWKFGDGDTLLRKDTAMVSHTFYVPDTYTVVLVTESEDGCIDSTTMDITIASAQIGVTDWPDVPNVFTPNGDGANDYFYIYNISIRTFKLSIFSRWGKKIYEYAGTGTDMLNNWKGWDGKIGNSDASEGVYYYILEVKVWETDADEIQLKNKNGIYKGFFYLFR